MAKTGTIKVRGSNLKIKKQRSFFNGFLTLTKNGWVVEPRPYTMLEGFYVSEYEAEEAFIQWLRQRNLHRSKSTDFPDALVGLNYKHQSTRECRPSALSEYQLKRFIPYLFGCTEELDEGWYSDNIDIWLRGQKLEQLAFASYGPNEIDGGQAVGVKVDSLGRALDYLSLADYICQGFQLPEGDWHYFV